MSDNTDQLAQLGEQVVAAITEAYNPHNDSTLALALHPGQAVADDVVQDGTVNELRLSEWLAAQYDNPMLLKLADGTPVTTTGLGGITARSAYATMARWGQPAVAADSPVFPRLAQLIADVRKDIGEHPDALPFGCEPTDFALADCPAWQVFDTKISNSTSVVTSTPGATPPVASNPELWKIRALSEVTLAELPRRRRLREEVQQISREMPDLTGAVAVERLQRARVLVQPEVADVSDSAVATVSEGAIAEASHTAVATDAITLDSSVAKYLRADTVADTAAFSLSDAVVTRPQMFATALSEASPARAFRAQEFARVRDHRNVGDELYVPPLETATTVQLDATLAQELVHVDVSDLAGQPAVSTATTTDTELHVHFEYVVVSLTRLLSGKPWWHPEFVAEPAWFVPGMKRGALVAESDDPAYGRCLPQSLLLVRNVSLTGAWSDEAKATMQQSVHYFGPFLMSPPAATESATTDAQNAEQTTVLGLGVQVIGELCSKLPALPPMDDPALAAS